MKINDRIQAKLQQFKANHSNGVDASTQFVQDQISARVSAALALNAGDEKLTAAMATVNMAELTASFPEQSHQITAGVRLVMAAFEQLEADDENNLPTEEEVSLEAFTTGLNSVLACLLVGSYARSEDQIVAAIEACGSDLQAAFHANDELQEQLADAVPVVLNALDVDIDDDEDDEGDDEIMAIAAVLTDFVTANAHDTKRLTALASNLNAIGNLTLATVQETL
ncbi:hypothetical protein [Yersinia ruckeri]|uniref:hypothetical protein n=1 Tax=Yersinia ruckeri TaxID=29486 RepID=UPI002237D5A3|nr:hypothetical protein [Yersinia ruckeri]MCW6598700.1 hypothetical protein [Yersinia ruckeri]